MGSVSGENSTFAAEQQPSRGRSRLLTMAVHVAIYILRGGLVCLACPSFFSFFLVSFPKLLMEWAAAAFRGGIMWEEGVLFSHSLLCSRHAQLPYTYSPSAAAVGGAYEYSPSGRPA